ncbi:MAG: (deoxy)nucleoside triphosphate pyrophosphohydrolase [Clostridiales bacterium]|nr:(deoxy)nucleoside triphosphate pyrophosphohydrolase [Clostridiales bacterium]
MKTVKVVAAIIRDGNKVFATQRGYGDYKDGWEFPGGKIESGETPQQALIREIKEELDTDIAVGDYLTTIEYDYPAFHLSMQCFWCRIVDGTLVLKEHEAARWLDVDHIDSVDWLPADLTIIDLIKDKMIDQVAVEILQTHKAAFEALAKQ